jgi:hypothetical protein
MRNTKYTTEEYAQQIIHYNIAPFEQYNGAHSKIVHLCILCQHKWYTTPGAVRNGHGCPECYQKSVRKPLSQVVQQINAIGWNLVNESDYRNSYKPLLFKHSCGEQVKSNLDRILRKSKRCLICSPAVPKKRWSTPVVSNNRSYASKLEMTCCEYLISLFGIHDVILQKSYGVTTRQTADAYIRSLDTYVEISSINKSFYLNRIYDKRKKVSNFIFVSSISQLKSFF